MVAASEACIFHSFIQVVNRRCGRISHSFSCISRSSGSRSSPHSLRVQLSCFSHACRTLLAAASPTLAELLPHDHIPDLCSPPLSSYACFRPLTSPATFHTFTLLVPRTGIAQWGKLRRTRGVGTHRCSQKDSSGHRSSSERAHARGRCDTSSDSSETNLGAIRVIRRDFAAFSSQRDG